MLTVYQNNLEKYLDEKGFEAIIINKKGYAKILSLQLPAGKYTVWLTAQLVCKKHAVEEDDTFRFETQLVSSHGNRVIVSQTQRFALSRSTGGNNDIITGISLHSTYESLEDHFLEFRFMCKPEETCWMYNIHFSALEVDKVLDGKPNEFLRKSRLTFLGRLIRAITGL